MTTTPDLMITLRLARPRHFMRLLSLRVGAESSDMHNDFICCFSPASPRCCWAFKTFHISHPTTAFSFCTSAEVSASTPIYTLLGANLWIDSRAGGPLYTHVLFMLRRDGYFWNVDCPGPKSNGRLNLGVAASPRQAGLSQAERPPVGKSAEIASAIPKVGCACISAGTIPVVLCFEGAETGR